MVFADTTSLSFMLAVASKWDNRTRTETGPSRKVELTLETHERY